MACVAGPQLYNELTHIPQRNIVAMVTSVNSRVTPLEHTLIGAVGGVTEVCAMQPMVAFKNALQEGRPLPRTPLAMYRGLLVRKAVPT